MQTHEIRRRFLDHFERAGHTVVPSASLISQDATVLFTIAGMAPFKPYFLGQSTPPFPRATSVQKCVRTGDIDNVGVTTRHNTFFQMAGNFSFGDYFKAGAIEHAWTLLTSSLADGGYGLDPDRLWVTVYESDDEAERLWQEIAGLPAERIQRRGMADNFWSMGVPGPCGPCSEIYYDRGPEYGIEGGPVADEDRYLEVWNLVFMQDMRGESDGSGKGDFPILGPLPQQNIDTGLGVERLAFLLQGVDNVYETDLLRPIIASMEQLSGKKYGGGDHQADVRFRVIADHSRSGMMLIGDGVTPGNEGRGYVLRRLLRRAVRSARLLGVTEPVMPTLMSIVRDLMSPSYPELATDYERIEKVAATEEKAFLRTIASGSKLFDVAAADLATQHVTTLPGATAFTLHDTQGFPIDLTLEMAAEAGLTVDVAGFERLMKEQKDRARADAKARKGGFADLSEYRRLLDQGATEFTGYSELQTEARIRGLLRDGVPVPAAHEGEEIELVLDRTPLYAESGGQDSDAGTIVGAHGAAEVLDVQKVDRKLVVHRVRITDGEFTTGAQVLAKVDPEWRLGARQAHSGTHVVHAALRQVLGPEALQSGSYNKPGYLRLDFAWDQALSAATRSELEEVANRAVRQDLPVRVLYGSMQEAQAMGAIALFGETYDDTVRIVEIGGPWSVELCGGTHVEHSSQIGPVAITAESSVGSGLRRVEAAVGIEAFHRLVAERTLVSQLASTLKVQPAELPGRIETLLDKLKSAEKELAGLRAAALGNVAGTLAGGAIDVAGVALVAATAPEGTAAGDLRTLASDVRGRLGDRPGVVALFAPAHASVPFAVAVNQGGIARGLAAGELAKAVLPLIEGRGGGKKDLAQGAGTRPDRIPEAIDALRAALLTAAG
ncbi:alanine--tRNA ligase [Nakamurella multipartita]|uniref:Alanine--tRNA ligase n=1 Tax=Nakamurella multipartita (strain ATCC 700099 / DSM 44233 / CIP 104796 / JCM 9543 / NBRC 105858 / Y-104) TaxID=479431 RepID=C8XD24_NAKMY|nr:alanine--tRNA ligase [Nakamurella multipartita]ACV79627.1 alanyl-tRNA synthetase [Nakamurella multipartita DSM 44233]